MQSPTSAAAPLVTVNSAAVGMIIEAIVLTNYWVRHIDSLSCVGAPDVISCKRLRAGNRIL